MDVTCPRCQTDYEFDDALVSERGTTVKCTNCGHQFRVFRNRGAAAATADVEIWRIDKRDGQMLELRSLVELQRAIRAGRVGRQDLLRRGDGAPRRVGDIPELEPFFPAARAEGSSGPHTMPLPALGDRPVTATPAWGHAIAPPEPSAARRPPSIPPPLKPPSVPPPPRVPVTVHTTPRPIAPDAPPLGFEPRDERPEQRVSFDEIAAEPPTHRRPDLTGPSMQPPVGPAHGGEEPTANEPPPALDALFASNAPPPKKGNGVLVALVVVGGLLVAAGTVGRPYLQKLLAGGPAAPSASGAANGDRLARELTGGQRARDEGDFAGAREAYLRATTLDDKSLQAWDGLCTAESELASAHWVAALLQGSALERDQASSIGAAAGRSCARWSELARASDDPKKVAADARPARALAAQGDGAGVRLYLPSHSGEAVFAALATMAEATKSDAAAIGAAAKSVAPSLLKTPAVGIASPADLALCATILQLAGQGPTAQEMIAELARRAPRHLLLETLRGTTPSTAASADAGAPSASASVVATGPAPSSNAAGVSGGTTTTPTGGGATSAGGDDTAGDYRSLNERAHKALAGGDATKAETLFRGALGQHPGDVDALYGLGQIARARGDHPGAMSYFKQVLDASSGFAPARIALADEQWNAGQQDEAKKNYTLYLERVSDGSGADRARSRTGLEKKTDPAPGSP
jgi:predicted Zn finger-like uncharacterized protein